MPIRGVVAAGHEQTVNAAVEVLREGGNAYDAVIAAFFVACTAEPVLASVGGGGFLLGCNSGRSPFLLDFFTDTPSKSKPEAELDFVRVEVDFGSTTQDFNIGLGAVAVPGIPRGLFEIQRAHASMPMQELAAQGVAAARNGITVTAQQAHIFDLVEPIYIGRASAQNVFGSAQEPGRVLREDELLCIPKLADFIETLAIEGEDLFYRGEVAERIALDSAGTGCLTINDLVGYEAKYRKPLQISFRDSILHTNPPPATSGSLIAFGLALIEGESPESRDFGSIEAVQRMVDVMDLTSIARTDMVQGNSKSSAQLEWPLDSNLLARFQQQLAGRVRSTRGTTHISVMDGKGSAVAMTVSNGEGCGEMISGAGIMLNNMLGEADLNPAGFHSWIPGQRMSSMMAPTLVRLADGTVIATGSGGSNRIRTAILQIVVNIVEHGMDLEQAIHAPRIHFEDGVLCIEGGLSRGVVDEMELRYPDCRHWPGLAFFFGGAHSVMSRGGKLSGVGDPRRAGDCRKV